MCRQYILTWEPGPEKSKLEIFLRDTTYNGCYIDHVIITRNWWGSMKSAMLIVTIPSTLDE